MVGYDERIKQASIKLKKYHDYSKQELTWINRIEKYFEHESIITAQYFDEVQFKDDGGYTHINKIFKNKLNDIIIELNDYLYDDGGALA